MKDDDYVPEEKSSTQQFLVTTIGFNIVSYQDTRTSRIEKVHAKARDKARRTLSHVRGKNK